MSGIGNLRNKTITILNGKLSYASELKLLLDVEEVTLEMKGEKAKELLNHENTHQIIMEGLRQNITRGEEDDE